MEKIETCPKCGGSELEFFLRCRDFTVSQEEFQIHSCKRCSFKFTNPRPGINEIGRYYESKDYISHSDTNKGIVNKLYHYIKGIAIKNKVDLIDRLSSNSKKLLDIGCGTGSFLAAANKSGWEAVGIEPNATARQSAIKNYTLSVFDEKKISEFNKSSFSVITMWHVMEHVHQLKSRILEIKNLLEDGGHAVIAVPNHLSWDAKKYQSFWAAYDVPRHLYHFSPTSIKELFSEFNLQHVESIPMKFDSYYVSMLSEKYKKSTLWFLNAVVSGFRSNLKARGDAEKFSSVIYVFRKN